MRGESDLSWLCSTVYFTQDWPKFHLHWLNRVKPFDSGLKSGVPTKPTAVTACRVELGQKKRVKSIFIGPAEIWDHIRMDDDCYEPVGVTADCVKCFTERWLLS